MNELCDLSNLAKRDTTFAIIAHAPIAKILDHKTPPDSLPHVFGVSQHV
jgi:predicted dithiol-disulfide oxidoreductase (DUF899 family)